MNQVILSPVYIPLGISRGRDQRFIPTTDDFLAVRTNRMRRDASRERLFFLLVLIGALLLLSGFMLRHDSAAPSTRTFRDGFTVAEDAVRRTENVATSDALDRNVTKPLQTQDPEAADVRMTTITTENGDEITIKRAATSKGNKVTTISRDEAGKLTIEDAAAEKAGREKTEVGAGSTGEGHEEVEQDALDDVVIVSPTAVRQNATEIIRREEEATIGSGQKRKVEEEVAVTHGSKKVTVVQVDRFLTKVSLSDIEESVGKEATR
uniref:DUF2382 domain-containing protein n=1 Tax=Peronospora matthiolae TaxID=2874970 RepID=A0AAV1TMJ0_9STRA